MQQNANTYPPEARIDVICYQGDPGGEEDAVETAPMRKHAAGVDVRQVAADKDEQQGEQVIQAIGEVSADYERGEDMVLAVNR